MTALEIRVENLAYVYNPGTPLEIRALQDVSFVLPSGKVLGILGGTGSGKTTLIKTLNGLLQPNRGRILLDGVDSGKLGAELRRRVGIVFQRPERQLFESTVEKDISFALRRFSDLNEREIQQKVKAAADLVGLDIESLAGRSPMALSEGEKRKAAIAGVLVNEPETLVLDEPAVGLDPPSIIELVNLVRQLNGSKESSVVIVSHDMEAFLPVLDLMMVLHEGRVAAFGPPAEVCEDLGDDPGMRNLLPELALLIHDLRKAGHSISSAEVRIPALVNRLLELRGTI
ncbi:MAG: ATP-binding cassette domain-containing protein [Desulfomonile tiedjei]|nr:ATP-binding cassette domain-containing protein [Desulfomonile tiedjei]